ncbi:MAG: undecaprenyl-diphosphate phosphatase [Clostridia bacterium]|nr:undecaprenyl-diphosphate phosphatase [Clostridia bacterium]
MSFIEFLKTFILGVIEGITEWLPVSSTGHMIIAEDFLKLNVSESFWEMFLVVIQLGAILAVICMYFNKLNPFSPKKSKTQRRATWDIWGKVIVGVLPAAALGFLLDDWMDDHLYNSFTVATTLILYGVLFIVIENINKNKQFSTKSFKHLSYKKALAIGCFQTLSLVPGTSRSGSTILGAMLMGTSREIAAEYSFFLAIPVMFGASLLKIAKFILKSEIAIAPNEISVLIVGIITSFVVSLFAIKFLVGFVKKYDFKVFGWYRIALGIIVILLGIFKII